MHLPQMSVPDTSRVLTEVFYGYNHNLRISQGESYDMVNMSCDHFPVLTERKRRGVVGTIASAAGFACKKQLAWVDGSSLYYAGARVDLGTIELSTAEADCPKQLVSMGAYLLVFPDGVYYNTLDAADYGRIDNEKTMETEISIRLCDGNYQQYDMEDITVSDTAPANPANGQMWIDTTAKPQSLKQYSAYTDEWTIVPSTLVRIGGTGIGAGFAAGDGVSISGIQHSGEEKTSVDEQAEALNGDTILQYAADDYIVVTGIVSGVYTQSGGLKVSRKAPRMDFVIESNNRLWGCRFGMENGQSLNEIYASKLGDFKNWRVYAGLSTDSYAVTVGSDGYFTGAITYKNLPHFFKEDCYYQIYGTMPSNYQVVHTEIAGVQRGSDRSLVSEGGLLYYKSPLGVCRFDGSQAAFISQPLGDEKYAGATAGSFKNKVYMCLKRPEGQGYTMMVYDAGKGYWCREDERQALFWASTEYDLYFVDEYGTIWSVLGTEGEKEDPVKWATVSAPMGYEEPNQKYLSRFSIRMRMSPGSTAQLWIQYDSSGKWERQGDMMKSGTVKTYLLPVRPRRCDHLQWKLTGEGTVEIYSVSKHYQVGSDAT